VIKVVPTAEGGMIILGGDLNGDLVSWLLKIDEDGIQEWHKHYGYEIGYQHFNQPFDVEQCSDGGYLIVGKYTNWNEPGTQARSWMVKTDPCGDIEWNGCVPVGIGDIEMIDQEDVRLYPNPTAGNFTIQLANLFHNGEVQIYNMMGSLVYHKRINGEKSGHALNLNSGIYLINLLEENRVVWLERLEIVR
jgi:hypothetical protein